MIPLRFAPDALLEDAAAGVVADAAGHRVAFVSGEFFRALHHVVGLEKPGRAPALLARVGRACGADLARDLEADAVAAGGRKLSELPLADAARLLEQAAAAHGWGILHCDTSSFAQDGLVLAELTRSYFSEISSDQTDFADSFVAGVLQGFFAYRGGDHLGCLELACVRRGAPACTFAVAAQERLDVVIPLLGTETAETIVHWLRS